MSDFTLANPDERIFSLNIIELAATIFRGPDADGWTAIFLSGVPELLANIPARMNHLRETLQNLQDCHQKQSDITQHLADLETEYVRLFIAAGGGVVAPLYQSCHLATAPRVMGDAALAMRSRLAEAGLEIALDSNEPPDHLSIELEYLYHLLATAWTSDRPPLEAQALDFARTDMLPWLIRFRTALAQGNPHPAYLCSADLTIAMLEWLGEKNASGDSRTLEKGS